MASAATATGATITEVRVTGCNGLSAAVAGRLSSSGLLGKKRFSAHSVLEKNTTMTSAPSTMVRIDKPKGRAFCFLMASNFNGAWPRVPAAQPPAGSTNRRRTD